MKKLICLVASLLLFGTMIGTALAETVTVTLGLTVDVEGTYPEVTETYVFKLTAADDDNPMPGGQVGGDSYLTIDGAGVKNFDGIVYDKVGVYSYTLNQVKGNNPKCTSYDSSVYHIKVTITSNIDGELLETIVLHRNDEGDKCGELRFKNSYEVEATPTPVPDQPKTGIQDMWPYYLGGAGLFMMLACAMMGILRKREENEK